MISMKSTLLVGLFLLFSPVNTVQPRTAKQVCKKAPCTLPNCQCYCGELCGPRPITKDDKPRYDKKTGKCFCADRDAGLYEKNKCAEVDAQAEAEDAEEPTKE